MPTNRKTIVRRRHSGHITAEVLGLWRCCREIQDAGGDQDWEEEGGRRREYLDRSTELNLALGIRPWEASPLDVDEGPPQGGPGTTFRASWGDAQEMRRKLEAATDG